jgi:hypothetical protein
MKTIFSTLIRARYILIVYVFTISIPAFADGYTDLVKAQIVVQQGNVQAIAAGNFLAEQVYIRSGIQLPVRTDTPATNVPLIFLGLAEDFSAPPGMTVPAKAESYGIWTDQFSGSPAVYLAGRDQRGMLFAAGKLVQLLYLAKDHVSVPSEIRISEAPADRLRAHQVITNTQSEDGFMEWDNADHLAGHVNDLVIAGANGFEPTQPELLDDYLESLGIELFVKLKCQEIIDLDSLPDAEVSSFFSEYSGIDHITTYGGDASGAVRPDLFFPHMERVLPLLLKDLPGVKWWYSNQCLEDHAKDYDDYIFNYLQENEPPWLYGMVYGPWTKRGISDIRSDLPSQYEIRHFPEICHPRWCQYPIPQWDRIFSIVWPRNQSIYAMPTMMRDIYLATRENTMGALPYNHTGTYNDLNKFVWTYAGWDPEAPVEEILQVYARLFFAHDFKQSPADPGARKIEKEVLIDQAVDYVTQALLLLEKNWWGPLDENNSTEQALEHWVRIADCIGGPAGNWRVEMFLEKARIDAQIKRKYDFEQALEREAYEIMRNARPGTIAETREKVIAVLARVDTEFQGKKDFLSELRKLGLTDKFGDREEIVDNIYTSFNDRNWILGMLENCETTDDLSAILNYEDPGPAGFYDNLGVDGEQPHLVGQHMWHEDPGFVHSPINWVDNDDDPDDRHSMLTHALARYDSPLEMKWCNLDKKAGYRIRVVYNGPFDIRIRCQTDDGLVVHDFIDKPGNEIVSFPVPKALTADGELILRWTQDTSDIMRGVSVSEIWLEKNGPE